MGLTPTELRREDIGDVLAAAMKESGKGGRGPMFYQDLCLFLSKEQVATGVSLAVALFILHCTCA
jgi:hypothetical protein